MYRYFIPCLLVIIRSYSSQENNYSITCENTCNQTCNENGYASGLCDRQLCYCINQEALKDDELEEENFEESYLVNVIYTSAKL